MRKSFVLIAAAVAAASAQSTFAAVIALGGATAPTGNLGLEIAPGETKVVTVWYHGTANALGTFPTALGFNIEATGASLTGSGFTWNRTSFNNIGTFTDTTTVTASSVTSNLGSGAYSVVSGTPRFTSAANSGLNRENGWKAIGTFSVTAPSTPITSDQTVSLFIVSGASGGVGGFAYSPAASERTFFGFASPGVSAPVLAGNPTLSGLDNAGVTATGGVPTPSATLFGFNAPATTPGIRTTTADGIITIKAPVASNPSISITAAGGSPTLVPGDNVSYVATKLAANSFVLGGTPGSGNRTLVAVDFAGLPANFDFSTITGATLPAGQSGLLSLFNVNAPISGGGTYDVVFDIGNVASGTVSFANLPSGASVSNLAVIPEPTSAAILGLAGLPLLSRRGRRA